MCPRFLLPVIDDRKNTFHLMEYKNGIVGFADVESYKRHGSDAQRGLTLMYYLELMSEKGVFFDFKHENGVFLIFLDCSYAG